MAEQTTQPSNELDRAAEEAGFYHEAALNAAWTGSRFAIGALAFLYGAFAFAYFYLRSVNSEGRWKGSGYHAPQMGYGVTILVLVLLSAVVQYVGLQRIKAGAKGVWQVAALVALLLGLAAVALQIVQLLSLPFQPGSSGFSSVFVDTYPALLVSWLGAMLWLEMLLMRARPLAPISFLEQPPTYAEAFAVQRFQSSLSAFTLIWNFMGIVTLFFFLLFYVF
jgi:heme/copper-type cytochrome/quinol oxidase subunit 3